MLLQEMQYIAVVFVVLLLLVVFFIKKDVVMTKVQRMRRKGKYSNLKKRDSSHRSDAHHHEIVPDMWIQNEGYNMRNRRDVNLPRPTDQLPPPQHYNNEPPPQFQPHQHDHHQASQQQQNLHPHWRNLMKNNVINLNNDQQRPNNVTQQQIYNPIQQQFFQGSPQQPQQQQQMQQQQQHQQQHQQQFQQPIMRQQQQQQHIHHLNVKPAINSPLKMDNNVVRNGIAFKANVVQLNTPLRANDKQPKAHNPAVMAVREEMPPTQQLSEGSLEAVTKPSEDLDLSSIKSERVPTHGGAEYELPVDSLKYGPLVGEGAFGRVYKGSWNGVVVAIKVLMCPTLSSELVGEFKREIAVMSSLRHPNVCMFLGAVTVAPDYCLVTEYCLNGSLWDLLHTRNSSGILVNTVNWKYLIHFVKGVACGFLYLHSMKPQPILHRDLKSGNLLIDAAYTIKLSDFGMSRLKSYTNTMTGGCGTFQWMAPEVLGSQRYKEEADVYSFGIVLWEIECARLGKPSVPYEGLQQVQAAVQVLNGLRPSIPPDASPKVATLCFKCWQKEPAMRPSFSDVLNTIQAWEES